jgi:hypothetical protein
MLRSNEDISALFDKENIVCLARELGSNNVALQLRALKIIAALVQADKKRDLLYAFEDLKVPLLL